MRTITYTITDLLKLARTGAFTVPLFQREFVWREAQVKLLIDSVSRNSPIGSLLVLAESASQMPHLAARPIDAIIRMWESGEDEAGGPSEGARSDRMYVLDGQQRLTSLVRVFLDAGQEKSHYVDLKRISDQFVANGSHVWKRSQSDLPWIRLLKRKEPNPERRERNRYLRSDLVLDTQKCQFYVAEYFEDSPDPDFEKRGKLWRRGASAATNHVFETIRNFQVPVVVIDNDAPLEAICRIFETINSTGTRLTTFDLSVARFYPEPDLRTKWTETLQISDALKRFEVDGERVLQVIAIWQAVERNEGLEAARGALLKLGRDFIVEKWDQAAKALDEAFTWAEQQGASPRAAPNHAIVVALAAFLGLADRSWRSQAVHFSTLLEKWYFAKLLQAGARQATNYRIGKDFTELLSWLRGGQAPECPAVYLSEQDLLDLRPSDARYRTLHAILARSVRHDLLTGAPLNPRVAEDHHIYPAALARSDGISRRRLDAITNRLFVSADTNRTLADRPPADYMAGVASEARKLRIEGRYDQRLREAGLPGSVSEARFADRFALTAFETFQRERARAILGLVRAVIEDALQERPITGRSEDEPEDISEEDDG